MSRLLTYVIIILTALPFEARAFNMRRVTSDDGLSNSAILSLALDDDGFLWIGTCDGVNIADGAAIRPFRSLYPGQHLSGNIIEKIVNGGDGEMWVLTNYGLDLVNMREWTVTDFPQFSGQELLSADPKGRLFVLTEDSGLYLYDTTRDKAFLDLGKLSVPYGSVRAITWRDGTLWVMASDGAYLYDVDSISPDSSRRLSPVAFYPHLASRFAKAQGNEIYIITPTGDLCSADVKGGLQLITNLSLPLSTRGDISDIIQGRRDNFFISFSTDGVIWVGRDASQSYITLDLGLHVGVFCLESSPVQDVVWIGSDCQGVYTYWDDRYSFRSFDFNDLGNRISHPVRAIFVDEQKNMWLGTKGDGLLKVADLDEYSPGRSLSKGHLFTTSNSGLLDNSVFGIASSSRPILWIATEKGLNYYSYTTDRLYPVVTDPPLKYVHGVYEANDTTLWLCTLGEGVARATIAGPSGAPVLRDLKIYALDNGHFSSNQFFAITVGKDGKPLFCNRGKGMYEVEDGKLREVPVKGDFDSNAVNDIFTAIKGDDTLWLGTGEGLVKVGPDGTKQYAGIANGFANNTIHDMTLDSKGNIWMSTNNGIVCFDPSTDKGITYAENYGLSVTEFSDGAVFNTGSTIIFGGINGVAFINRNSADTSTEPYRPRLSLITLSVSGEDVPAGEFLSRRHGQEQLTLAPNQNHFSITVASPDFIDSGNYLYSYTLDGKNWIGNGASPTVSFSGMHYGTYTFTMKCLNRATGIESDPYTLRIVVRAPWYLSGWARALYLLMLIGLVVAGVALYMRRQREKQRVALDRLERVHKEEVYEEKLKFFTNITHEFCTPLTLIYGPCERILDYPGSDDYIRRYVGLVRTNAERLNTLIQELIDFRRMETGHKRLKLTSVGVSQLCSDIITSFSELADRNRVELVDEIEPDIVWTTDFECLRKTLTNLISNAFKYTPTGGTIRISLRCDGDKLRLSVYNTGRGIDEEGKRRIFNRYSVLDNVEENAVKGLSSRNGLGLAICHSMVDMLKGTISIESEVGKYADFIVELPRLKEEGTESPAPLPSAPRPVEEVAPPTVESGVRPPEPVAAVVNNGESRGNLLVVDDNREILTLLRDSFSDYKVIVAESADKALEIIRDTPPDLIISDIMMPGTDGVTFTKMVKQNKHTMHTPLILLSAKTSNEERVEGIDSGADAYVGKPFSVTYLKALVNRMLENRRYLKEYYNTAAGAFEYNEGKLMHRDDKAFVDSMVDYIEAHINDSELSPERLAEQASLSLRNLYRRFKELELPSPSDFIKRQRITYAAKLLVTTTETVQEIIYSSGFSNRSHFYKEFDKRFGMTPKDYRTQHGVADSSLE